jgi:RNase P/RNase MRP subunit POP5
MTAADRLEALKIDMAIWSEKREGYKRVAFSPILWPALKDLARAAEAIDSTAFVLTEHKMGDGTGVVGIARQEFDALSAALANLNESLR